MAYKPDIGTFTRKVSFCHPTTTKSAMGAPKKNYARSFDAWCSREQNNSGSEQYITSRLVVPQRYTYRGHYMSAIDETYQLLDGSEKFNILSIVATDRNMFIEIVVEKIAE
jgi:hypothetical protein